MTWKLATANCPTCGQPFGNFVFYQLGQFPITCTVYCRNCKKIVMELPPSRYFGAGCVWFFGCSLAMMFGAGLFSLFFPPPTPLLLGIFLFLSSLAIGGFLGSQVILRAIESERGPSPEKTSER